MNAPLVDRPKTKKVKNNKKAKAKAISLQRVRRLRKVTVNSSDNMDVNAIKIVASLIHRLVLSKKKGVDNMGSSHRLKRRRRAEIVQNAIVPVKRPNERFVGFFGSTPMTESVSEEVTMMDIHRPTMSTQNNGGIWHLSPMAEILIPHTLT